MQSHQIVADATRTLTGTYSAGSATGATVSKSGQITYQAAAGAANSVAVSLSGGNFSFVESGITAGPGCTQVTTSRVDCSAVGTTVVTMNLGDGDDTVTTPSSTYRGFVLNGGEGSDVLNGGDKKDTFDGGAGNDTLNGAAGNDYLNGGTGADRFNGGAGIDRALYSDHSSGISVDIEPTGPDSDDDGNASDDSAGSRDDVMPSIEWISGTGRADMINATLAEVAVSLFGRGSTDTLTDGPFDDALNGGGGADTINCVNGGNDTNVADAADTVNGDC